MDRSDYIDFVLERLAPLDVVSARRMFGGYVIHMAGKVLGFVFDDEFYFEPGPTIDSLLPDAMRKELFPGSKLFVIIDDAISSRRLCEIAMACYDDFPLPKPRKKKSLSKSSSSSSSKTRDTSEENRFPFLKNFERAT